MTPEVRLSLELAGRVLLSGLRTYTLVGLGSALIMVVSQYGFGDAAIAGRRAQAGVSYCTLAT